MTRRIIALTEGHSDPHSAKTACSVIRYRRDEIVAILDSTQVGHAPQDVLGVGAGLSFVAALDDAPPADTLLIGIAPPGGVVPAAWRKIILAAMQRGMNVLSGLHEFLSDDPEFKAAAERYQVKLTDVRKNNFKEISRRVPLRDDCLRILTVGHDCAVGKMVVAIELTRALQRHGRDAKFIATGQTGIIIEGDGYPIDCITADFVSGAAEKMMLDNDHREFLVIEGQGSLVHPSYSAVTLGLLHGAVPHALILCYEVGRRTVTGIPHMEIPPLATIKELNELMASVMQPCPVIAIAMNGRQLSAEAAEHEKRRVQSEFNLPVTDVIRDGPDLLLQTVLDFQTQQTATRTA